MTVLPQTGRDEGKIPGTPMTTDQRPLRIGIICPYSFETPGGVQAHVKEFSEELRSRGHQVSVLAPGRRTKDMPLWVETTNTSFAFPYNGSVAHISYFGFIGNTVRRWVDQGHFDILHLHEPEIPSLSHKVFFKGYRHPPVVATFHTSFEEYPVALKVCERYLRRWLLSVKEAIFVSPSAQRIATHYLDPSIERVVIPNGIHCSFYSQAQARPEWEGTAQAPTIGFLGRMNENRKGFDVFARSMPGVLAFYPQARFLCAGDGREAAEKVLRQVGKEAGVDLTPHVEFLGRISDEDKARFYRSLSVYVAPQRGGESFGIVLAEAMAAGCPLVASDLEAFRDVSQEGRSARLFTNEDAGSLGGEILTLLADQDLRQGLVAREKTRSRDFDWSTIADRIEGIYRRYC